MPVSPSRRRAPRITLLPGDGIGPEVLAQARKALDALRGPDFDFEAVEAPVGGAAVDAVGEPLPAATIELAMGSDAVLVGAIGDTRYDDGPPATQPARAILGLRTKLGLFASLREVSVPTALAQIERAITRVLDADLRTVDVHQPGTRRIGTGKMGDAIAREIARS